MLADTRNGPRFGWPLKKAQLAMFMKTPMHFFHCDATSRNFFSSKKVFFDLCFFKIFFKIKSLENFQPKNNNFSKKSIVDATTYFLLCNKKSRFDFADELKVGYVRYKHLTQITIKVQLF